MRCIDREQFNAEEGRVKHDERWRTNPTRKGRCIKFQVSVSHLPELLLYFPRTRLIHSDGSLMEWYSSRDLHLYCCTRVFT